MSVVLCAVATCRIPGRHNPGCTQDTCPGCLVATAADGLRLCRHHADRLTTDLTQAAHLHHELELVLAHADGRGEHVTGSRDPNTVLNEHAADARTLIRHTLVSWTRLVAEERGVSLPADSIDGIAGFLHRHTTWLAAHPAAGDYADELAGLAHGQPWRAAYPTGARSFTVGPCPQATPDGVCPGVIRVILRRTDALLPSELVCDTHDQHRWTADQWRGLYRQLQPDGVVARTYTAHTIAAEWRLPLGTVYRLAHDHEWQRTADGRRPVLYMASDVEATMRQRQEVAA